MALKKKRLAVWLLLGSLSFGLAAAYSFIWAVPLGKLRIAVCDQFSIFAADPRCQAPAVIAVFFYAYFFASIILLGFSIYSFVRMKP
jgi:hypothetical protein